MDFIQRATGVPFPVALGLIKGLSGDIELELQAAVNTQSRSVSVAHRRAGDPQCDRRRSHQSVALAR